MPFLLFLKPVMDFLKALPREVWYGVALLVILLILRSHWVGVGIDRCEAKHKKAYDKAVAEAQAQEKRAPAVAQEARDEVKPRVEERVKYVRELVKSEPISCDDAYGSRVQESIREARAAAD